MNQIQKKILLIFFIIFHNGINPMHEIVRPRTEEFKSNQTHQTYSSSHTAFPKEIIETQSEVKMQPKTDMYQTIKKPTQTVWPLRFDLKTEQLQTKQATKSIPVSLDLKTEHGRPRQPEKTSGVLLETQNYLHTEQMEAPLETYVQKINSEFKANFPFIENILPENFFRSFSIVYIVDQSAGWLGYNKVKLNEILLENIDWHTPSPSPIQKFAAGLSELAIASNTSKSSQILDYKPNFKDVKSMSIIMGRYIWALQENPLFAIQEPILLQQYVLAVLKESKSGQPGWLFGSYPILQPKDVLLYIPGKKEAWPTEKNSEGDYIGEPSACQKIYAMMEAIRDIPEQAIKIESEDIQRSRYGQVIDTISNIPTQMGRYITSTAYNFAMAQLQKQISPQLYNKIVSIFESQNPVDTAKKIALQEILNRDRSASQGEPFLDQHDLEVVQQIIREEASHFVKTAGPVLAQGLREQSQTSFQVRQPLLDRQAQDIFNDITFAALDRGAEILMDKLFTPDEIAQIEQDALRQELVFQKEKNAALSEKLIQNYLELKNKQTENALNKGSFNRSSRSAITLYFIDSFQASAQKIGRSKENLQKFISSIITSFSRLKNLTTKEEAALQQAAAEETYNLLDNEDSWIHAKTSEFHLKFSTWMENFITKMYASVGKINPKYQYSLEFGSSENPLTPKVDIIWNDKEVDPTKKVTSVLVTYKDVKMRFDLKDNNIIFDENSGIYTIATELFSQPKPKTVLESISAAISDNLINGVLIEPLAKSAQGNLAAQQEIQALKDSLTSQGQEKEGILVMQYDPINERLTTTVAKKNENGQVSKIAKEYSTQTQELLSQKIILSPKNSEGFLGSSDTYTPNVIIKDPSPQIIDPTKKGLSFQAEYQHPQTGEIFVFNGQPEDISVDEFGTYKITGTLKTTQQMAPLPDGIEGHIIKIMQKIIPQLNIKAYRLAVSNFRTSWTGARIARQYPQLYTAAEKWMLDNYEVGVESIEIEYNPTHNVVATKTFSIMALGQVQGKKLYFPLN